MKFVISKTKQGTELIAISWIVMITPDEKDASRCTLRMGDGKAYTINESSADLIERIQEAEKTP